ncbi:MAG: T9SS type A sorting domain-containing protein [Bacteroidota bacterium]|nr:T9SS type A sorting domain-containing protein [Bacteroidota bacterium]
MVLVTDSLDCKGQSSSLIVNGLKINSNLNRELNIYPNPFINDLRLISTSSDSYNYQLTDVKGRILRSGIFQNQKAINTADLSHGMYFLRLTKNQETIVYKILKQ